MHIHTNTYYVDADVVVVDEQPASPNKTNKAIALWGPSTGGLHNKASFCGLTHNNNNKKTNCQTTTTICQIPKCSMSGRNYKQ